MTMATNCSDEAIVASAFSHSSLQNQTKRCRSFEKRPMTFNITNQGQVLKWIPTYLKHASSSPKSRLKEFSFFLEKATRGDTRTKNKKVRKRVANRATLSSSSKFVCYNTLLPNFSIQCFKDWKCKEPCLSKSRCQETPGVSRSWEGELCSNKLW